MARFLVLYPITYSSEAATMSKPVKHYQLGDVHASIFLNQVSEGADFHTVNLERRYKQGGDWKSSSSFTSQQLANALAVGQLALNYVIAQESNRDD